MTSAANPWVVAVRLRPLSALEEFRSRDVAVFRASPDCKALLFEPPPGGPPARAAGGPASYGFDHVFGPEAGSEDVHAAVGRPLVHAALAGVHATLFAFGQTGGGKTHTMKAVMEASAAELFDGIAATPGREFLLRLTAVEVYNEARARRAAAKKSLVPALRVLCVASTAASSRALPRLVATHQVVRDLLRDDTPALHLKEVPGRGGVAQGAKEEAVRSARHLLSLLELLEPRRQVGDNGAHTASSRSHLVVRLAVESRPTANPAAPTTDALPATTSVASPSFAPSPGPHRGSLCAALTFVDLAGAERKSASSAAATLKEGTHINRSLLALGTVIRKLAEGAGARHVPFRDSKLTRMLSASLSGHGRSAVICCASPASGAMEATRATLAFAANAARCTAFAVVNEAPSPAGGSTAGAVAADKQLLRQYAAEIATLRAQLASTKAEAEAGAGASRAEAEAATAARAAAERRLRGLELFLLSATGGWAPPPSPGSASRRGRHGGDGDNDWARSPRRHRGRSWSPPAAFGPDERRPLSRGEGLAAVSLHWEASPPNDNAASRRSAHLTRAASPPRHGSVTSGRPPRGSARRTLQWGGGGGGGGSARASTAGGAAASRYSDDDHEGGGRS